VRGPWIATGVAAVVLAVVAVPGALSGSGASRPAASQPSGTTSVPSSPTASPSVTTPTPAASATPEPLADGQTVQASGRVVSVPGRPVRLCAPVPESAVGYADGDEPAPAWCPLGYDLTGVDLHRLSMVRTKDGATEGWGFVRGIYRGGTIAVALQSGLRQDPPLYAAATTPPCPVPADGWHRLHRGNNPPLADTVGSYGRAHPGQVVSLAIFRPNDTTAVVVAAVTDVATVRAAVPRDPSALCLVQSQWTSAEVAAALAPFEADQTTYADGAGASVLEAGEGIAASGQVELDIQVVALTPKVEAWAAAAPAGLVHMVRWLATVPAGSALPSMVPSGPPTISPASASLYASEDAAYPSLGPSS
jgi:hypothetical protein